MQGVYKRRIVRRNGVTRQGRAEAVPGWKLMSPGMSSARHGSDCVPIIYRSRTCFLRRWVHPSTSYAHALLGTSPMHIRLHFVENDDNGRYGGQAVFAISSVDRRAVPILFRAPFFFFSLLLRLFPHTISSRNIYNTARSICAHAPHAFPLHSRSQTRLAPIS